MTLFLDSSVLLAACGSGKGASREIFRRAPKQPWTLITIPYVLEEVARNLRNLPPEASADWVRLRRQLRIEDNVLSLDRPAVFVPAKDRPILFSALAWSDVLLTLDTRDFGELLGQRVLRIGCVAAGRLLGTRTRDGPLALNDLSFPPSEDRQLLRRAEAAQRLQGCRRLCGCWLAAGPSHNTGFPFNSGPNLPRPVLTENQIFWESGVL